MMPEKSALIWTLEAMTSHTEPACFTPYDLGGLLDGKNNEWFADLAFLQVWGSVYHATYTRVLSNPEVGWRCSVCALTSTSAKYSDCTGVPIPPGIGKVIAAQQAWIRGTKVSAISKPVLMMVLDALKESFENTVAVDKYGSVSSYA